LLWPSSQLRQSKAACLETHRVLTVLRALPLFARLGQVLVCWWRAHQIRIHMASLDAPLPPELAVGDDDSSPLTGN